MPTPVYQLAFGEKQQFEDVNGNPLAGAKMFVYTAGTSTKATSYQETDGVSANTNPIILDGTGALPKGVYVTTGLYKLVLAPSTDSDPPLSPIWTRDQLTPINDTNQTQNEWLDAAGGTPSFISTTQFSVTGDQTPTFLVRRRIKVVDSGGTKYGFVSAASFGAGITTVTVVLDSGVLANPITSVQVGILTPTNISIPNMKDDQFFVVGSADVTKRVRLEVDGLTTATTRVGTVPDFDFRFANVPSGIVVDYAGSSVPTGWLECDGSVISRTGANAGLFAAIGTTWGVGDGSTTFGLPDFRGRVRLGRGTGTNVESFTNSAINTGTDAATVASNTDKWITGMQVTFTTGGTPPTTNPANLLDNNDVVFVVRIDATTIKFATSLANASIGTVIDITAAGSGTFTITQTLTARTLGQSGGEFKHTQDSTELPSHNHTQNSHTHTSLTGAVQAYSGPSGTSNPSGGTAGNIAITQGTGSATATNIATGNSGIEFNVTQPYGVTMAIISL